MSKASEWARGAREPRDMPCFVLDAPNYSGAAVSVRNTSVGEDGALWICGERIEADRAVLLAQWILDTFGERP